MLHVPLDGSYNLETSYRFGLSTSSYATWDYNKQYITDNNRKSHEFFLFAFEQRENSHKELTGLKKTSWELYSVFNYSDLLACLRGKDYVNLD